MHKKRLIRFTKYFIGFSAAILFLYFVLGFQMPAMKKRIFIFGLWFFAEIYLWIGIFRTFDFFPKKEKSSRWKKIKETLKNSIRHCVLNLIQNLPQSPKDKGACPLVKTNEMLKQVQHDGLIFRSSIACLTARRQVISTLFLPIFNPYRDI